MLNEKGSFYIDDYITSVTGVKFDDPSKRLIAHDRKTRFYELCHNIKEFFKKELEYDSVSDPETAKAVLDRQKRAIIGYPTEVNYYKEKIAEYLKQNDRQNESYPSWYKNLVDGIFHENWGLAGIQEWLEELRPDLVGSSSAKIIGDRIYFLINGRQVLQEQRISFERRLQLRRALILNTPEKKLRDDHNEVYTVDGTRITIYGDKLTKPNQEAFIFRKYHVKDFSFERQAELGTIPKEAIPMLAAMAKVGYNVAFVGPVRSAKTTFLTTWQQYEDRTLEGAVIETDPEIPFHLIMPDAPIISLVADGDKLKGLMKSILRSDPDYIIMAEARDNLAFHIALDVTDRGTRRSKMTCHFTRAINFPFDFANKVHELVGGDLFNHIIKVAQNWNYVFGFQQLQDKSQKRLTGIYELRYNHLMHKITIHQICKYRFDQDDWVWSYDIGEDKTEIGRQENSTAYEIFDSELKKLSLMFPMDSESVFTPAYEHLKKG